MYCMSSLEIEHVALDKRKNEELNNKIFAGGDFCAREPKIVLLERGYPEQKRSQRA